MKKSNFKKMTPQLLQTCRVGSTVLSPAFHNFNVFLGEVVNFLSSLQNVLATKVKEHSINTGNTRWERLAERNQTSLLYDCFWINIWSVLTGRRDCPLFSSEINCIFLVIDQFAITAKGRSSVPQLVYLLNLGSVYSYHSYYHCVYRL